MVDETIENEKGPLGLKTGSVRAIIVLTLIALAGIFLYLDKSLPEWLIALVVMGVSFYFGTRQNT